MFWWEGLLEGKSPGILNPTVGQINYIITEDFEAKTRNTWPKFCHTKYWMTHSEKSDFFMTLAAFPGKGDFCDSPGHLMPNAPDRESIRRAKRRPAAPRTSDAMTINPSRGYFRWASRLRRRRRRSAACSTPLMAPPERQRRGATPAGRQPALHATVSFIASLASRFGSAAGAPASASAGAPPVQPTNGRQQNPAVIKKPYNLYLPAQNSNWSRGNSEVGQKRRDTDRYVWPHFLK